MAKLEHNRADTESFLKFLSRAVGESSAHLRVEIFEGATFKKAIQLSAANWQAIADETWKESTELSDAFVILGVVSKGTSPRQACNDRDIERLVAFAIDTSDDSIKAARKYAKPGIMLESANGCDGIFVLAESRRPAELTGLTQDIEGLTKKFLGPNRVSFKARVPGTVSHPKHISAFPAERALVKMAVI